MVDDLDKYRRKNVILKKDMGKDNFLKSDDKSDYCRSYSSETYQGSNHRKKLTTKADLIRKLNLAQEWSGKFHK